MKIDDLFNLTFKAIFQRNLRSWLTIIGIVIGIATVVAINTLGEGLKLAVNSELSFLGADLLRISSGKMSATMDQTAGQHPMVDSFFNLPSSGVLTENDVSSISNTYGVEAVNGIISGSTNIKFKDQFIITTLQGVNPSDWTEVLNYDVEDGRLLTDSDTYAAVVGHAFAQEFFENEEVRVGDTLIIEDLTFRVVGVLESGGGFGLQESYVFIPMTAARKILTNFGDNIVNSIELKVSDPNIIDSVSEQVSEKLRTLHHVEEGDEDFTITSSKTIQERVTSVLSIITFFVSGIAAISLIVGGVGIMNTMFMSIMERTREIGIMKAIGAKSRDVLLLFIVEAGIIGFIGGLLGAGAGFIGAIFGAEVLNMQMEPVKIPVLFYPQLVMLSVLFAAGVGVLAGYLPARRASNLNPIDALRYE